VVKFFSAMPVWWCAMPHSAKTRLCAMQHSAQSRAVQLRSLFSVLPGREIWLWPGDLALSCNPSYLGGQSSGMVWSGMISVRHRIDFHVRTKASYQMQLVCGAWKSAWGYNPEDSPLQPPDLKTPTNIAKPCSFVLYSYCNVEITNKSLKKILRKKLFSVDKKLRVKRPVLWDFLPLFCHKPTPSSPLILVLKYFRISFRIRRDIREYVLIMRYAALRWIPIMCYAAQLIINHIFANISANSKQNSKIF
jgi:hypothetical protein